MLLTETTHFHTMRRGFKPEAEKPEGSKRSPTLLSPGLVSFLAAARTGTAEFSLPVRKIDVHTNEKPGRGAT